MPSKEVFQKNWEEFKKRYIRTGKVVKYPKIAVCYITKDAEEFIEYSIKSVYPLASKIIVVDNCSKDKTLEILEKMEDPQKKITVISREFKNKTEQRNVYCDILDGYDYAFIVDSDEVWDGENLRKVEHLIFANPEVPAFCFNFVDFWKDLGNVSKGIWEQFTGRKSLINLNICGKIKYDLHTLPVLSDGRDIPALFTKDIFFHHYSYVRTDKQIKDKINYYIKTGTPGFQQQSDWYENVWLAWDKDPTGVEQKYGNHLFGKPSWTEKFTGEHPNVMKNHPRFLQYIDKYKTKVNMSASPKQMDNFINISMQDDIFNISKKTGGKKPYLVFIEDLLEHISFNAIGEMLVKVYDQMELSGEIILKIFNLQEVVKRYAEGNLTYVDFIKIMYGDQKESWDYHSCIYNRDAMKALLEDVGFSIITMETIENNLYLYTVARKCKELK